MIYEGFTSLNIDTPNEVSKTGVKSVGLSINSKIQLSKCRFLIHLLIDHLVYL